MLFHHKNFLKNVMIQRRIALIFGCQPHKDNNSALQLLSFELIQFICSLIVVNNDHGLRLVKAAGYSTCVETYKWYFRDVFKCCNLATPTNATPSILWLLPHLNRDGLLEPNWDALPENYPTLNDSLREQVKLKMWTLALGQCSFWTKCHRWFLKGHSRNSNHQLLIYETIEDASSVKSLLSQILGEDNMNRCIHVVDSSYNGTLIFVTTNSRILKAVQDDILFQAFSSLGGDDRVMQLRLHQPGFVCNI